MSFDLLHPREQIVSIMKRIYVGEMTTLSGGNLSILDDEGNLWITPAGLDKGKLQPSDIVCILADGTKVGSHAPSSEYPFHKAIYEKRPDLKAVVHAHPPGLVSFSVAGLIPDTRIIPQANHVCGPVKFAPYALPGSEQLGENIANTFAEGVNIVMLENHGVACGGRNLLEAYQRMETLDFCANTLINAQRIGKIKTLTDEQLELFRGREHILPEFDIQIHSSRERELRQQIVEIVHRACDRQLMISTEGVVSVRLGEDSFLITPTGLDRRGLEITDIVMVKKEERERGKYPSRSVNLHNAIYKRNPDICSIIMAQSPHATAYSATSSEFDSRIIPESYILLRKPSVIPFNTFYKEPIKVAESITEESPVLLVENDCVLTLGRNILEAFDRLEVLEYSAKAMLMLPLLGVPKLIDEKKIQEIEEKFFAK
jgi:L-fuculose-phosphate aldolase